MSMVLISSTEKFRVDTEEEVADFIETVKDEAVNRGYTLKSYSSALKEKKKNKEVVDSGYLVTIVKEHREFFDTEE